MLKTSHVSFSNCHRYLSAPIQFLKSLWHIFNKYVFRPIFDVVGGTIKYAKSFVITDYSSMSAEELENEILLSRRPYKAINAVFKNSQIEDKVGFFCSVCKKTNLFEYMYDTEEVECDKDFLGSILDEMYKRGRSDNSYVIKIAKVVIHIIEKPNLPFKDIGIIHKFLDKCDVGLILFKLKQSTVMHLSERLQNSFEFIEKALAYKTDSLKILSKYCDQQQIQLALKYIFQKCRFKSEDIERNFLLNISTCGYPCAHLLKDCLKNDIDLVLKLFQNNSELALINDHNKKAILLRCIDQDSDDVTIFKLRKKFTDDDFRAILLEKNYLKGSFDDLLTDDIKADYDFMLELIKKDRSKYPLCSQTLKSDKSFNEAVIEADYQVIEFINFEDDQSWREVLLSFNKSPLRFKILDLVLAKCKSLSDELTGLGFEDEAELNKLANESYMDISLWLEINKELLESRQFIMRMVDKGLFESPYNVSAIFEFVPSWKKDLELALHHFNIYREKNGVYSVLVDYAKKMYAEEIQNNPKVKAIKTSLDIAVQREEENLRSIKKLADSFNDKVTEYNRLRKVH